MGRGRGIEVWSTFLAWGIAVACTTALHGETELAKLPQLVIDPEGVRGNWVTAIDISPDQQWLAAADGSTVRVWRIENGELWHTLRGFQEPHGLLIGTINSVVFSPDSRFLLVGVSDNTKLGSTRVYELSNPDRIHRLLTGHSGCTSGIAFSPNGKHLATWSCDGTMVVSRWDRDRGETSESFQVQFRTDPRTVSKVAFKYFGFPMDDEWLIHCDGRSVQFVSLSQRQATSEFRTIPEPLQRCFLYPEQQVVQGVYSDLLSPVTKLKLKAEVLNRTCPSCSSGGCGVGGCGAETEEERIEREKRPSDLIDKMLDVGTLHCGSVDLMAVAGATIHWKPGQSDYWIGLWSQSSGTPRRYYNDHRYFPTAIAMKPKMNLAASADALGEIHLWRLSDLRPFRILRSGAQPLYGVHWPRDGRSLLVSTRPLPQGEYRYNAAGRIDHEIRLDRRVYTERVLRQDMEANPTFVDRVTGIRYELSSTPGSGYLRIRDVTDETDKQEKFAFFISSFASQADGDTPTSFAILPGARRIDAVNILVGTQRGRLFQLGFDREMLVIRRVFVGHDSTVSSISVSPDGSHFVSASFDGTLRIWRLTQLRTLGDLKAVFWGKQIMNFDYESQAQHIGLRIGDQIQSFDGRPFYERMTGMLEGKYRPGQKVALTWLRSAQADAPTAVDSDKIAPAKSGEMEATITLEAAPDYTEPVLTFFLSTNREWVIWDAAGYYDASPNGERFIGWHLNGERHEPAIFHRVNQFHEILYKPILIDRTLSELGFDVEFAPKNSQLASENALSETSFQQAFPDIEPPEVRLVAPRRVEIDGTHTIVEADIYTRKTFALKEITFRVNGRSPKEPHLVRHSTDQGDGILMRVTQTIELDPGENEIELTASHARAQSLPARLVLKRTQSEAPRVVRPNLYVLAVGVSEYADSTLNLGFAHQDARDFTAACEKMRESLYGEVECKLLLNSEAKAADVRSALGWLSQKAQDSRDVAILFMAGHGGFDHFEEWFFATHDIDQTDLNRNRIDMSELEKWLHGRIRAGKNVVILDTCHAGGVQQHRAIRAFSSFGRNPWQDQGTSQDNVFYMVSCINKDTAIEDPKWQNGAYTEAMLRMLEPGQADSDRDGFVSFNEASIYLERYVPVLTDGKQHPSGKKPLNLHNFNLFQVLSP